MEATAIHSQDLPSAGKNTAFKNVIVWKFCQRFLEPLWIVFVVVVDVIFGQAHYVPRRLQLPEFDVDHPVSCCSTL